MNMNSNDRIIVCFGTIFSMMGVPFITIWTTLFLGLIGAVGAYLGTMLCKLIFRVLKKMLGGDK